LPVSLYTLYKVEYEYKFKTFSRLPILCYICTCILYKSIVPALQFPHRDPLSHYGSTAKNIPSQQQQSIDEMEDCKEGEAIP
jgi:hypothetical protein